MENSNFEDILADQVAKVAKKETVFAIAILAKSCLNINGKQRPTMREVALELEVVFNQQQYVSVLCPKNPQEAIDQTLSKMRQCEIDGLLPPCTSFTE